MLKWDRVFYIAFRPIVCNNELEFNGMFILKESFALMNEIISVFSGGGGGVPNLPLMKNVKTSQV